MLILEIFQGIYRITCHVQDFLNIFMIYQAKIALDVFHFPLPSIWIMCIKRLLAYAYTFKA